MLVRAREMATICQFLHDAGCMSAETEGVYLDLIQLARQRFASACQVEGPIRIRGDRQ